MIRQAVADDRDAVVRLLEHSRLGAGFDRKDGPSGFTFPFVPSYAARLFRAHLAPHHICLLYVVHGVPQGVLMAIAYEHPFGPVWLARETMWFIEPNHRGGLAAVKMLEQYEQWARAQGCTFVGMAGMGDDPAVGLLYRRRGYNIAETQFLKAL